MTSSSSRTATTTAATSPSPSTSKIRRLAPALALALLSLGACTSGRPINPPAPGPVAVARFDLEDASRPRTIPVRVAYPLGSARALPVVIFSHGAYSSRDDYAPVTDVWAARGYVVVSVTHLDSVALGAVRGKPTPGAWAGRVADVRYLLAHLEDLGARVPPLRGRIDTQHIALAGHSLGGMVAQAFGGMTGMNPETHERYALRDPRIRAIVVLSGVGPMPPATQVADFATLDTPLFVSVGTRDLAMPQIVAKGGLELRREPFELAPAGHKYLLVLTDADHYLGGMVGRDDLPKSPEGTKYVAAFDELSGLFLDAWLKHDPRARARLDAFSVPPDLTGVASFTRG